MFYTSEVLTELNFSSRTFLLWNQLPQVEVSRNQRWRPSRFKLNQFFDPGTYVSNPIPAVQLYFVHIEHPLAMMQENPTHCQNTRILRNEKSEDTSLVGSALKMRSRQSKLTKIPYIR